VLYDLWNRATAKWRGILVYVLLQAVTRFVTGVIALEADTHWWKLYAALVSVGISLFCLTEMWRLLSTDSEGDENWPPLWS